MSSAIVDTDVSHIQDKYENLSKVESERACLIVISIRRENSECFGRIIRHCAKDQSLNAEARRCLKARHLLVNKKIKCFLRRYIRDNIVKCDDDKGFYNIRDVINSTPQEEVYL